MSFRATRPFLTVALAGSLVVAAAACGSGGSGSGTKGSARTETITLLTHDSFAVSKPVLAAFTRQTGIRVKVDKSVGDAGSALSQAILTKGNPIADAFYGVDNTFLSRALDAGIYEPWTAAGLDRVPEALQLDPSHRVTPIDYGDVCVNYDEAWFASRHRRAPATLADLAAPEYRDLTVVEKPSTSSTGLAFLLATVARYGESGWHDYWKRLRANGVLVEPGWDQAYDGAFTAGGGSGTRPIVVSYASSPPADVVYSSPKKARPTVGVVHDGCFRQVEFAGILKGTHHHDAAGKLIDFLLSLRFQQDMPLQMYVFPARTDAKLPAVFEQWAYRPADPLTLDPATISAHRDAWIEQWTALVVR
ncbi:MAG TPA: thiamine ABC transporter substrate-binding protein [Acidimicrobiia bacterium]